MHVVISIPPRRKAVDWAGGVLQGLYLDLVERMTAAAAEINAEPQGARMRVTGRDAAWREDLHPRASNGRFGHGSEETHSDGENAKPTSATAKGAFAGLHELLSSGHSFTKEELMKAVGMEREKKFSDYMAMLKNPKYAGKLGALQIQKTPEGLYRVVTAEGRPAPPPGAPAPEKALPKPDMTAAKPAAPKVVPAAPQAPITAKPAGTAAWGAEVPEFKTSKEAAAWAVANNLVDRADFGTIDPAVAREHLQSISEHLAEFPALRKRMNFAGSVQAFNREQYEKKKISYAEIHGKHYPNATPEESRRAAERYVTKPKVSGSTWAQASSGRLGQEASVAFNEKFVGKGKAAGGFKERLEYNVGTRWHPVGCDTVKSIADHEYGHQLDFLLMLSIHPGMRNLQEEAMRTSPSGMTLEKPEVVPRQQQRLGNAFAHGDYNAALKENMAANVSRYAATNMQEFIAESWAEYRNNPTPRPTAAKVGALIKEIYAGNHPAA